VQMVNNLQVQMVNYLQVQMVHANKNKKHKPTKSNLLQLTPTREKNYHKNLVQAKLQELKKHNTERPKNVSNVSCTPPTENHDNTNPLFELRIESFPVDFLRCR
jgi:hypothetical protein